MKRKDQRKSEHGKIGTKPLVGVAWYSPAQWRQMHNVAADADQLEATYEEWLDAAERAFEQMMAEGIAPIKVPVDIQELISWCQAQNVPIDASARSRYVVEILKERFVQPDSIKMAREE